MKILLAAVNAKYIHANPAVYSLAAYAKEHGVGQTGAVEIAEFTINQTDGEILRGIWERQPDVLAFSCYIWNLELIEKLLPDLPQILPDTDIWMGGPEVSYDCEDFLEAHPQVKGILAGEGEQTFAELAAWYENGRPMEELCGIRGLVFWDGAGIVRNERRPLLDLDELPFLYWNLESFENRIIYYESSRGCPFSCSYCLSSIEKSVRFRSAGKVKEELQFFLDRRVPQVKFVDRTFNCRHSHALEIWRYIRDHDNGVTNFHFEIAADLLNEEELALVGSMRPGLIQMEIGVQSTNPRTLEAIRRVSDLRNLSRIVGRLQENANIHLHLDLIAGLPFEDYESFVRSFNDVYRLHPEQLQLGFLKVLKGSAMHKSAGEYGLRYRKNPVYEVLGTRWISYRELLALKDVEEMLEIYYNSGQFARTVRRLESEFPHPFALYEALAGYCAQKTGGQKQSRQARFELLRDFIRARTDDPVYDDLLLFDAYLRENCKSRPGWAKEPAAYRERILAFYQREEKERALLVGYAGRSAKQMMHMTHLERFAHDVAGDCRPGEHWLLFDYQVRDALTGDASVRDVTGLV